MNIEFITKTDLEAHTQKIIEALKPKANSGNNKRYLRSSEVRKMLNISPGTLQNLRISNKLPFTRLGTTIFYDYEEIIKILEENSSH